MGKTTLQNEDPLGFEAFWLDEFGVEWQPRPGHVGQHRKPTPETTILRRAGRRNARRKASGPLLIVAGLALLLPACNGVAPTPQPAVPGAVPTPSAIGGAS